MSSEAMIEFADCRPVDLGSEWSNSYPLFLRKARQFVAGGVQDPKDLISQATVKVLGYLKPEREASNFVGLMLVSLLQVYLDGIRLHGNRVFAHAGEFADDSFDGGHAGTMPGVERSYIAKETLGDIFDCIATMPQSAQELFQLRFVRDLSYAEIGKVMGITEACARQKVKKLRLKLQSWVEN